MGTISYLKTQKLARGSLFHHYQMTESSIFGRKIRNGDHLRFKRALLLCFLTCFFIQTSIASNRSIRSREKYTRSSRSVKDIYSRDPYTRSSRSFIEPYSRETYTRSSRAVIPLLRQPYSTHKNAALKENDSQLLNLVHILSKLAIHIPKEYTNSLKMNKEDPLAQFQAMQNPEQNTKENDLPQYLGKEGALKNEDLGPFALLYAMQSASPRGTHNIEESEGITRRSMPSYHSSRWNGGRWFWNGGRATSVRLTK